MLIFLLKHIFDGTVLIIRTWLINKGYSIQGNWHLFDAYLKINHLSVEKIVHTKES